MEFITGHIGIILWLALIFSIIANILLFKKKILPLFRKEKQRDKSSKSQEVQKSGQELVAKVMPDPPEGSDRT